MLNENDAPPAYYAVLTPSGECGNCALHHGVRSCTVARGGFQCDREGRKDGCLVVFRPRSELAYIDQPRAVRDLLRD